MGKVTSETRNRTTTTHFSHPHPLKLTTYLHHHQQPQQQTPNLASSCSACNVKPSGLVYSCTTCSFLLHEECYKLPMKITHPFHKEHVFTLLPKPAYPEGLFDCDACGRAGKGFSYHCKPCGVDLHVLCAVMPLALTCIHHAHELKLTFEPPYGDKSFCCDICKTQAASRHWLYRCVPCGFDAHLNCARGHAPNVAPPPPPQHAGFGPQFVVGTPCQPMQQGFTSGPMNVAGVFGFNGHNNESITQGVQQIMNHSIAANQAILAGSVGGGLCVNRQSDESISQAIQQMINQQNAMAQSLLAAGGFGGSPASVASGGFGGSNAIGGGGGTGGQDFLQGLMSGGGSGGGGGFDLQSLLGGGHSDFLGGSGGLDVLGGAMGGFSL